MTHPAFPLHRPLHGNVDTKRLDLLYCVALIHLECHHQEGKLKSFYPAPESDDRHAMSYFFTCGWPLASSPAVAEVAAATYGLATQLRAMELFQSMTAALSPPPLLPSDWLKTCQTFLQSIAHAAGRLRESGFPGRTIPFRSADAVRRTQPATSISDRRSLLHKCHGWVEQQGAGVPAHLDAYSKLAVLLVVMPQWQGDEYVQYLFGQLDIPASEIAVPGTWEEHEQAGGNE
ncbi:hypothetical protein AURDEDRAFT_160861 [Auricularia subglabra TFB-10046 SS5]|nr:hypothetical protein AURDEDRAFT_160861 [Auricularia subglabra TFB-10046 SS5]